MSDRYSRTPAAGLVVLGSQGEANLLSEDETRQVLGSAIGAAAAEKVMMAGVSRDSLAGTLAAAEFAASVRYDAVVVQAPSMLRGAGRAKEISDLLSDGGGPISAAGGAGRLCVAGR